MSRSYKIANIYIFSLDCDHRSQVESSLLSGLVLVYVMVHEFVG